MAAINSHTTDLRQRLEKEPNQFEFFQAVRVLRWLAHSLPSTDHHHGRQSIGYDASPAEEVVRCKSHLSHSFPQGPVSSFRWRDSKANTPPELVTAFLGLTGPSGVLPRHYTQLLIDRVRSKDTALRDFFDLFNHRLISHFYRAWAKYRLPISFEHTMLGQFDRQRDDKFTSCLFCYVGMGTPALRNRLEIPDATFLFFAGHFAHRPRNAVSLETMVADHFRVESQVVQFVGQWLYLEPSDQSTLRANMPLTSNNNALGKDVVVGRRVWGVENKFRIRLGPISYQQFLQYTPAGNQLRRLAQFVRMYAGGEFDFDVQLVLDKREVPMCQLGDTTAAARLGWNTWLHNRPFTNNADDATFAVEGNPV